MNEYLEAKKKVHKIESNNIKEKNPKINLVKPDILSAASRNIALKDLLTKTTNRTNNNSLYSKNKQNNKKENSNIETNLTNTNTNANSSYSMYAKKNVNNINNSQNLSNRVNNLNSSLPKNDKLIISNKHTNFMNYKVLSQNTSNTKHKIENNLVSNSFNNIPNNSTNNYVNNSLILDHQNRNKLQNCLLNNNNVSKNDSFNNNANIRSRFITPEISRRNFNFEGSLYENVKEKKYISNFSFENNNTCVNNDKTEDNIMKIFNEHNRSGLVINTAILRQLIRDNPEIFENKKSKNSTKDNTIKYTNYSTKSTEFDSIEYIHFLFVNFFQKSKQIIILQENNSFVPDVDNIDLMTVSPCDELEIE